jgi:hypothetical protein
MPPPKFNYRRGFFPPPGPRTGPPPTASDLLPDGRRDAQVHAVVPKPLLLEAERQAAHELKSVASYVRAALLEKILRAIKREQASRRASAAPSSARMPRG